MELSVVISSRQRVQPPEMQPAIERIVQFVDMYARKEISEHRCHELVIYQIIRIKSYNAHISRLNLDAFKQCKRIAPPIFHRINLHQIYEDGKNLLEHVLPSPTTTLLLIQEGLFSKKAILHYIKYNYLESLDLLLKRLTKYNLPESGIEYNLFMLFLIKLLNTSIVDGNETSLCLICRYCKKYFIYYNQRTFS